MTFRSVFLAVVIAFALILGAFLINRARPTGETEQPWRLWFALPANAPSVTRVRSIRWSMSMR